MILLKFQHGAHLWEELSFYCVRFASKLTVLRLSKVFTFLPECTVPWLKNHYSRDIHEIDPQCDHVISCDIEFDLQRELATRRYRGSRRCQTEARYHTIALLINLMNISAVMIFWPG